MEKVTGIGGVFFRARNPAALSRWYAEHLGVTETPADAGVQPWMQSAGPTVWGTFPEDTDYFRRPEKTWMINFRVRDLAAMVAQLRAASIEVEDPVDYPPIGRFTRLSDPEDNQIELWEPKDP
jgi:predicted enzyme related to lactoylglutathione lyase